MCGILSVLVLSYTERGAALSRGVSDSSLAGYCSYGADLLWEVAPGGKESE